MKRVRLTAALCGLVACLAVNGCSIRPAIRLERTGAVVVVHVETLGEYPTTIRGVRIEDVAARRVVLELRAESGTPQIYSFKLMAGENPTRLADPEHGEYRIEVPRGKGTFVLQKGVPYRLTIWGEGRWPAKADVEF